MAPPGRHGSKRRGNFQGSRGSRGSRGKQRIHRFPTNRVQEAKEQSQSDTDDDEQQDAAAQESVVEEDFSPDGSDTNDTGGGAKAYDVLMQSLRAQHAEKEPSRKKRRIEAAVDAVKKDRGDDIYPPVEPTSAKQRNGESQRNGAGDVDAPDAGEDQGTSADEDEEAEDEEIGHDPFRTHFADLNDGELTQCVAAIKQGSWQKRPREDMSVGRVTQMVPQVAGDGVDHPLPSYTGLGSLKLKNRLSITAAALCAEFQDLEKSLAPLIFNYTDLLFCARTVNNAAALRRLACLHVLNHLLKTRDRVIKNNGRAARHQGMAELEIRDQGFTRPKILILLPTRQACARYVESLVDLFQPEQQENKKRFQDAFAQAVDDLSPSKPDDFRDLFGGNDDDMFRIGLKLTRKTIRYFAPFYSSDIIIASPLGLYTTMASETGRKHDHDFLSSIEVVVMDHADAFLMQNWDHMEYILEHLNLQPKEAHGCDFSRVRNWYLDDQSRYLRQTIMFTAFNAPDLNSVFVHHMQNVSGKVRVTPKYPGAIVELGARFKQTFNRFQSSSPAADPDARFKYFTAAVVPRLNTKGTLIFVPSYFDFVRIRNFFSTSTATQNLSFGAISEYTPVRDVARARSHFFNGRHSVLLYTERAHHFRRFHLRGVTRVIMYALPDNFIFYREIAGNYLEATVREGKLDLGAASVRSIYSKWDALKLERIVGTERVAALLPEGSGDVFEFT